MSLLQEGLESNFVNWVLVLATTFVVVRLDEFLLKLSFEHSWPLIRVQKQSIDLSFLEFLDRFYGHLHYCFTERIDCFRVEHCHYVTRITNFGSRYQYFWRDFIWVERFFCRSLLTISWCCVSSGAQNLSIFSNDSFPPVVEFHQSFFPILIISIIRPSYKLYFWLILCILGIFNFGIGILFFDLGDSLLKTFFLTLFWCLRNFLLFNRFSSSNLTNSREDHIDNVRL